MVQKLILSITLIFLFTVAALPQANKDAKKEEISAEVKKEAVAFLRETAVEVNTLRTPENRISFNGEMASLMWFHDEKEARAMFQRVVTDFKQLLVELDSQMNFYKIELDDEDRHVSFLSPASTPKAKLMKKFSQAIGVRQQIAMSLSEHDPVLAYSFFTETTQAITNPALRQQIDNQYGHLEMSLITAIAEKDPDKALETARKKMTNGVNHQHLELLKKIYEKDVEKGIAFGEEIIRKLKSDSAKSDTLYFLQSVLVMGAGNLKQSKEKPGKKPIFSDQSLREAAEIAAQMLLKQSELSEYPEKQTLALIEQFLPARAAQIRQKFGIKNEENQSPTEKDRPPGDFKIADVKREKQEELMKDLQNLGDKKLSAEERAKIINQSRKIIAAFDDPMVKITALVGLATQVAKVGDKETALEIMKEAEGLVNLQPKNYLDYLQNWMLAAAYTEVEAPKAFSILEDSIFLLNDTLSAFVKVAEFIDVSNEIIEDGEVQVGSFGGEMTRSLLRELGATNATLRGLAKSDFTKTKNLANKFDRTEVRILAKMLILRAVLGNQADQRIDYSKVILEGEDIEQ